MRWLQIVVGCFFISLESFSQGHNLRDSSYVLKLNSKARAAFNTGVDSIVVYAKEALKIAEEINYPRGIADAYASFGYYYLKVSNNKEALKYFNESAKLASRNGLQKTEASAILGQGIVYFNLNDAGRATERYLESLKIYERIKDAAGQGACFNNLGVVYRDEKLYDKAIDAFNSAIASYQKVGKGVNIASAFANIGSVHQANGDFRNSLKYNKRALRMSDSLRSPLGQIESLNNLGEAHTSLDSPQLALKEFNASLELSKRYGFGSNSVNSLVGIANVNKRIGKFDLAIKYLLDAENIAKQKEMNSDLVGIYDSLGENYIKIAKYGEAAFAFKKAMKLKDSIRDLESTKSLNNLSLKYEVEKKEDEIRLLQEEKRNSVLNRNIYFGTPLVALIIIFLLYRQQVIKNQRDNQLMRQKEEMMKLNYLSKINEGKLIALRTQLNPHFIFNCLNSINSYIIKADSKSGSEMLLKFAKLVRIILEKSDKKMISFEDELKLMNLYIELERLKSNGMFDINLNVDKNIDPQLFHVPSLIAQPFVENAVMHAFTERKSGNRISIDYSLKDNLLLCIVEDNGVGRKNSSSKNGKHEFKEKSLGISISEQRLKLLGINSDEEHFVQIEDLYTPNGNSAGTRVVINIPFVLKHENLGSLI